MSRGRPRVLFYSPYYFPHVGGAERFGASLVRAFSQLGVRVKVISMVDGYAGEEGIEILRRPPVTRVLEMMKWADVIHLNGLSRRGLVLARLVGRPVVVTHHGFQAVCPTGVGECERRRVGSVILCSHLWRGPHPQSVRWILRRISYGTLARLPHAHVCPSRYLADELGLSQAVIIPNPVAPEFGPRAHDARGNTVGFVGALSREKGIDIIIEAILADQQASGAPRLRWLIMGDGPHARKVDELTRAYPGSVSWVRATPQQVPTLLRRIDVIAVPSRVPESFCYAAAEALCAGVPAVVSRAGALPETLGGAGILLERTDTASVLRAVRGVIAWSATTKAEWLARAAEQRVRFNPVRIAHSYLTLYQSLAYGTPSALHAAGPEAAGLDG